MYLSETHKANKFWSYRNAPMNTATKTVWRSKRTKGQTLKFYLSYLVINLKFCLCYLYRCRDWFGRILSTSGTLSIYYDIRVLMDGFTENKVWRKFWADVHFRLKESQPFRGMVYIVVWIKKTAWSSVSLHAVDV